MKVFLEKEATGAEIVAAVKKAAARIGFSCDLNTEYAFEKGSVKKVPLYHMPKLTRKTGLLWGKTSILVGTQGKDNGYPREYSISELDDMGKYREVDIVLDVPQCNPMCYPIWFGRIVDSTRDSCFATKAEPYFGEFTQAFFEELERSERVHGQDNAA